MVPSSATAIEAPIAFTVSTSQRSTAQHPAGHATVSSGHRPQPSSMVPLQLSSTTPSQLSVAAHALAPSGVAASLAPASLAPTSESVLASTIDAASTPAPPPPPHAASTKDSAINPRR